MPTPQSHPNVLRADDTALVVIDMQEPFLRPIFERERVLHNVGMLIQGAKILRLPMVVTTQYCARMGDTVPPIQELLPEGLSAFDKFCFSCQADPAFAAEVERSGRKQILLCGIESHICVSQTAHGLLAAGYQVHVAVDAISARSEANWKLGLEKMRQSGVIPASVESALYEMMHESGTPEFREMLKLIKEAEDLSQPESALRIP